VVFDLKNVFIPLIRLRSEVHQININTIETAFADNRSNCYRLSVVGICVANSTAAYYPSTVILGATVEELGATLASAVNTYSKVSL
jgi:hypothetical protein